MNRHIQFDYHFHPVGQGLFCTGMLVDPRFHWVFDCGSMAREPELIQQVSWYRDLVLQQSEIGLLCISHFDKDHVSGLAKLLDGKHVGTVVIPYYTPVERLVIGAAQDGRRGDGGGEYADFLSNPLAFLIERAASIREIIVIHRSPPEDSDWPFGGNMRPDSPVTDLSDRPLNPDFQRRHEQSVGERNYPDVKVKLLDSQSSQSPPGFAKGLLDTFNQWGGYHSYVGDKCQLRTCAPNANGLNPMWEFLFFHKPEDPNAISRLIPEIDMVLSDMERRTGARPALFDALRDNGTRNSIRDAYRRVFRTPKRSNAAGVCMYAGPVADKFECSAISFPRIWHGIPPKTLSNINMEYWDYRLHYFRHPGCTAILYSGDADFQPQQHRNELRQFLTDDRWQNVHILQVPHHGSEKSWQVGSANEFCHQWSVFCADPQYKHHHPNQLVLLDLLERNPLLVDRIAGVSWSGICHFEGS